MARKYTPKGGAGGKRPGAGRKPGSGNVLPLGEVRALKAIGLRVPEGASEEQRQYAHFTENRIIDVMLGNVEPSLAMAVLKAASTLREEQLGPVKQKLELSGALENLTDEQLAARYAALVAKGTATATQIPGGAGTTAADAAPTSKGDGGASLGSEGSGS